ncbi:MAG TPA: ATP-binding protein, partial [Acidimicrobiales bacterium]|nr:ATP-binding protein [Acidimicrobiales bacterium]
MRSSIELPAERDSAAACRQWLRGLLAGENGEVRDVAVLLASEVVTNALLHAGTAVTVTLELGGHELRVEVADRSPLPPVRRQLGPGAPMGRGLLILDSLATSWGVDLDPDRSGKVLWFVLDRLALATTLRHEQPLRPLTPEPGPPEGWRRCRLLGTPVAVFERCLEDHGSLVRELRMLEDTLRGAHGAEPDALGALVAEIAGTSIATLWRAITTACEQAMAESARHEIADADAAGLDTADLDTVLPEGASEAAALLDQFFERVDRVWVPGWRLLSPRPGATSQALRRWLLDEVRRQGAGKAPTPWSSSAWASPARGAGNDQP